MFFSKNTRACATLRLCTIMMSRSKVRSFTEFPEALSHHVRVAQSDGGETPAGGGEVVRPVSASDLAHVELARPGGERRSLLPGFKTRSTSSITTSPASARTCARTGSRRNRSSSRDRGAPLRRPPSTRLRASSRRRSSRARARSSRGEVEPAHLGAHAGGGERDHSRSARDVEHRRAKSAT